MAENFVWYGSFTDTLELLDEPLQVELFKAIIAYGSKCEEPEFSSSLMQAMFISIRNAIDNAKARYEESVENGKKGGRPPKLSEDQKNMILELVGRGQSFDSIAIEVGCSVSTVKRFYREITEGQNCSKGVKRGQNLKVLPTKRVQNLNKDIDININKDIDIDIDMFRTADAVHDNANTQPTDSDLISTANKLGYTIDEDTASRISGYCDSVGITEKGQWFKFCMCKAAEKGLLHGKDKEQCKRIVVSAAINSKDKWSYLTDDFPQWLERKKPSKAWSSGITLPPVEECVTAEQVAQVFSSLRFKTPAE